ncbi:MAG: hypothetical protein AB4352_27700 [Hormoscilla sp.]
MTHQLNHISALLVYPDRAIDVKSLSQVIFPSVKGTDTPRIIG